MPIVTPPTRLDLIEKQIGELYKKINEEVEKDDKVQKIMTVPGIGPITALSYVASGSGRMVMHTVKKRRGLERKI